MKIYTPRRLKKDDQEQNERHNSLRHNVLRIKLPPHREHTCFLIIQTNPFMFSGIQLLLFLRLWRETHEHVMCGQSAAL
jgi:hypothetical protein